VPLSWFGRGDKEKIPSPCREMKSKRPTRSLIIILTELAQLTHRNVYNLPS